MALELNFTPYYNLTLPISKKDVQYRPYFIGEELTFLTHLESKSPKDIITSIMELTKNCLKDDDVFDELNIIDFTFLTAHIRAKSKGEIVEVEKKCPDCGKMIPAIFDITKDLKVSNSDHVKELVTIYENLSVELGILPANYMFKLVELEGENKELVTIAASVKKIIYNNKIHNGLEIEDVLETLVKKFTKINLEKITVALNKLPEIYGLIKFDCPNCEYSNDEEVQDVLSFLS